MMIFFVFLAFLAVFGSTCYAFFSLSWPFLAFSLLCAGGATLFFSPYDFTSLRKSRWLASPVKTLTAYLAHTFSQEGLMNVLTLAGVILSFIGFMQAATTTAILTAQRTLWAVFSPSHLLWLAAGFFLLLISKSFRSIGVFLICFCALSLSAFVYPIGFGFDPFIHRAAVSYIAQHGLITPKTPYYIGQYVIELVATVFMRLPLQTFDVFLAPGLCALVLAHLARDRHCFRAVDFALLLPFFPLSAFVQTTPQALAFIFTILTIFSPRAVRLRCDFSIIFALAAFACHPIAGIPAVIFTALRATERIRLPHLQKISFRMLVLLGSLSVPAAFIVLSAVSSQDVGFSFFHALAASRLPLSIFFTTRFDAFLDTAYIVISNLWLFIFSLAIYGMFLAKRSGIFQEYRASIFMVVVCLVNFVLISLFFDFPFLPTYERTDFALRLFTLAQLFCLPLAGLSLSHIFSLSRKRGGAALIFSSLLLTIIFCANVYGAYPRDDRMSRSAAFNVSASDVAMVREIDTLVQTPDYAVLADQTLSAAAIQAFGFRRYYHGDIFYYPVPTGGPLYQVYLDMAEHGPSLEKIAQARRITGVDTIVFAVHRYWWNSNNIMENAKALTTRFSCSEDQSVCAFIYTTR